jgi:hypothetical protein
MPFFDTDPPTAGNPADGRQRRSETQTPAAESRRGRLGKG